MCQFHRPSVLDSVQQQLCPVVARQVGQIILITVIVIVVIVICVTSITVVILRGIVHQLADAAAQVVADHQALVVGRQHAMEVFSPQQLQSLSVPGD